jgi:hypothetical protein
MPSPCGVGFVLTILALIVWQGTTQEIIAVHPARVTDPSEVNLKVRQPLAFPSVACEMPGPMVPV